MDGCIDGCENGQLNEWINKWMNEWIKRRPGILSALMKSSCLRRKIEHKNKTKQKI